jgi:hypothetical protein
LCNIEIFGTPSIKGPKNKHAKGKNMSNANDRTLLAGIQMNQSFVSEPVILIRNNTYCFQAQWTGVPVGNFSLQSSCDSAEDPVNDPPVTFIPINGALSPAGGAAGTLIFSYQQAPVPYNWVQFVYTYNTGSGLLVSLKFNGK